MKFELNPEMHPRACVEGSRLNIQKADLQICELTVSEFRNLFTFWSFQILEGMSQPRELLPLFYNRKELAAILKLSTTIIDQLIHNGQLKAHYISKRPVVLHNDLVEFINKNVFAATLKEPSDPIEFSKQEIKS